MSGGGTTPPQIRLPCVSAIYILFIWNKQHDEEIDRISESIYTEYAKYDYFLLFFFERMIGSFQHSVVNQIRNTNKTV